MLPPPSMTREAQKTLNQILATIAFAFGIIAVEIILWRHHESLGNTLWWLQLPLGLSTLAVTFLSGSGDSRATSALRPSADTITAPDNDPEAVREQLVELAEQIENRERDLTERLKTFHEWMEFPQPLTVADPDSETAAEISAKDKQLFKLIETESKRAFDKILNGAYSTDGKVRVEEIRDEATDLIRRIARIYQPGASDPLLETSVAQILHASSRASLQFITVLEELPLDVKEYSIQNIYDYVEKGVKAYGVYKKFEPYKPYVDTAYYLGRFAMGASPLSLGAWWLVGTIGQKGAQALTTHVLEGQALTFLHNLIRVIGYEVAGIYSGDFRHRDPNWFYASELVELIHTFPASRRSLDRSLNEIGRLTLRSEYDRIYLYRCLAANQSAKPAQYDANILSTAERSQIAERLEQIFIEDIHGATPERIAEWKQGLEQRLNVQIKLDTEAAAKRSEQDSLTLAARSLASFLVDRREIEPADLTKFIETTSVLKVMDPALRAQWLLTAEKDPPFYFEPPDLDPDSPITKKYLADLIALAVEIPPYRNDTRELIIEVAHFLRQDEAATAKGFGEAIVTRVSRNLSAFQPDAQITPEAAETLALALPSGSAIRFVYGDITTDPATEADTVLYADDDQCALLTQNETTPLWNADSTTVITQQTTLGQGHCQITGGQWKDGKDRTIKVDLPILSSYATHFQPLLERFPEA
jgi:hypothetical protein